MTENDRIFYSLREAADYINTTRQAVYLAIKKGDLLAIRHQIFNSPKSAGRPQWIIKQSDLDEYRRHKHSPEKRKVDGEQIFDLSKDRWSIKDSAKALHVALGRPYSTQHIHYLLRRGRIRGYKKGGCWVLKREELLRIYQEESSQSSDSEAIKQILA